MCVSSFSVCCDKTSLKGERITCGSEFETYSIIMAKKSQCQEIGAANHIVSAMVKWIREQPSCFLFIQSRTPR